MMDHITPTTLSSWQNFYVIVGSSAGALTGLQFVVITLITQFRATDDMRNIHAFGTPTVIHFCAGLLVSAFMTAPWQNLTSLGCCLTICAIAGVAYSVRVLWHAKRATYQPDWEDWLWYVASPFIAHTALLAAGVLLWANRTWPLDIVAADAIAFVLLGVHNAWDTVTYVAIRHGRADASKAEEQVERT